MTHMRIRFGNQPSSQRRPRKRVARVLSVALLACACSESPYVPPEGVPQLFRAAEAEPELYDSALDGCVEVHHVWKAQVRAVHRTSRKSVDERIQMLMDSAHAPFAEFWAGYNSGFEQWARRDFDLAGDSRSAIPTQVDLLDLIAETTARVAEMTGRLGCAEWFLVYGPGWANLGGLGDGSMLIDFFGLPTEGSIDNIRHYLPHEVGHIVRRRARHDPDRPAPPDPDRGTVLSSIIEEGFASYFADAYWGEEMTPNQALGYSEAEWRWALTHETELWEIAASELEETKRRVIRRYRAAREHLVSDGPGKVGYFIGYRIVEAYVAKHGNGSLHALIDLPVRQILEASGYAR